MQAQVSLLENSPFLPPGKEAGGAASETGPASLAKLQLRGITSIDGQYIFSVYNPETRESKWISQGQAEDGLIIRSYDPENNSVVIHSESEGLSRQMEMNDYAAPVALKAPPQPSPQPVTRAAPTPVSPTGTLSRAQESIQRPTRRNLETLRARRAELAEKLRNQPRPGGNDQGTTNNDTSGDQDRN